MTLLEDAVARSLTVKRNWTAHTRRQHKFNDSDRAHRASVTSKTIAYSSMDVAIKCCCCFVPGVILSKNVKDSRAKRSETDFCTLNKWSVIKFKKRP